MANPCLTCEACCAHFRVSFYWAEADDAAPGGVPAELTEKLDDFRRIMRGTGGRPPRCTALEGEPGTSTFCSIYEKRPSVCREFRPSWLDGEPDEHCDRARRLFDLEPLTPDSWSDDPFFRAA